MDCAWSEDENLGEFVMMVSVDGIVCVWCVEMGECLKIVDVCEEGVGVVMCVDVCVMMDDAGTTSDDCVVVAGLMDGLVRFFYVCMGVCVLILVGYFGVVMLVVMLDVLEMWMDLVKVCTRVCYGCRDGVVGCFDVFSDEGG